MAKMIPATLPAQTESKAEKKLFPILRNGLDNRYTVFHSFNLLTHNIHGKFIEGEIDYLIFSPSLGFLVLEVKGGFIVYNGKQDTWYQNNRPMDVNPFKQASASKYKQRIISPEVNKTELATLVDGASAFAFDLYQTLKETDGNIFYSPYSISLALAMTYAGARGETEQQMTDTLHFNIPQDHLHPAFNSLDSELSQRGEGAEGEDGEGYKLNIVNAIWGQKDYQFLSTFLDLLAENYGTGLRILDFAKEPEESRITINNWVSNQTEGRIKDLIPKGLIHIYTRLVLTNAIYFDAAWQNPFEDGKTSNGPFYLRSGDKVDVPMMKQTASLGYTEYDGLQAIPKKRLQITLNSTRISSPRALFTETLLGKYAMNSWNYLMNG